MCESMNSIQEIEHRCIEFFRFVDLRAMAGLIHDLKPDVGHFLHSGLAVRKGKDTILPAPYHQYGRFIFFYECRKVCNQPFLHACHVARFTEERGSCAGFRVAR